MQSHDEDILAAFDRWSAAKLCPRVLAEWARFFLLLCGDLKPGSGLHFRILCMYLWILCSPVAAPRVMTHGLRPTLPAESRPPVGAQSTVRRNRALADFEAFIDPFALNFILEDVRMLLGWVVQFGRHLYQEDRPYYLYAELLNALVDKRRSLKRQLDESWSFADLWRTLEPVQHRLAVPRLLLRALISLSLMWGWPVFASLVAFAWSALCRMGEVLTAARKHLMLPRDTADGLHRAFLRIMQPKSRWKAAKQQLARCDEWWVIKLLDLLYGLAPGSQILWPMSAAAFRGRWNRLCGALDVPHVESESGVTPGGLRGGGATALYEETEDLPLVRRRGRWMREATVEIYLQEVAHAELLNRLSEQSKKMLRQLSAMLPAVLNIAFINLEARVPFHMWYATFKPVMM